MAHSSEKAGPPKKKRKRTIIPPEQIDKLEALFLREQWPSRLRKEDLAQELGQTEHFVSVWFQNRRARQKKEDLLTKTHVDDQMIPILSSPALLNTRSTLSSSFTSDEMDHEHEPEFNTTNAKNIPVIKVDQGVTSSAIKIPVSNSNIHNILSNSAFQICNMIKKKVIPSTAPHTSVRKIEKGRILPYRKIEINSHELSKKIAQSGLRPTGTKIMKILVKQKSDDDACRKSLVLDRPSGSKLCEKQSTATVTNSASSNSTITTVSVAQNIQAQNKDAEEVKMSGHSKCSNLTEQPQKTLFQAIINMICVAEGGILDKNSPEYDIAVNDYLYGIIVNGDTRLVYNKESGLEFIPNPYK